MNINVNRNDNISLVINIHNTVWIKRTCCFGNVHPRDSRLEYTFPSKRDRSRWGNALVFTSGYGQRDLTTSFPVLQLIVLLDPIGI